MQLVHLLTSILALSDVIASSMTFDNFNVSGITVLYVVFAPQTLMIVY